MDIFNKRDLEGELINWELYKAYGHFNLCFEAVVATFREFLIEMVRLSYGFDVDWEDPETEDVVDSRLQDRLIKIILHDDGANAIIEKCRSCFFDMANPETQKVLRENDVEPLKISQEFLTIGDLIFKRSLELVKLRNVIIHSHYEGVIYNILPIRKLQGKKNVRTSKGFEERTYDLSVDYLNSIIMQIEYLEDVTHKLCYYTTCFVENEEFDTDTINKLNHMDFKLPKS